jgi:HEAT repeat protein
LQACEAAVALSKQEKDKAIRLLVQLSREGDATVRVRAAECMMEVGGERAVLGLVDLLRDPNPQVRSAAIGALGVLRAHYAEPNLRELLKNDEDVSVRITAARTLGRLGHRDGLKYVMTLLSNDNEFFRRMAVRALRDIIGQDFPATQAGVEEAKRYLEMNRSKYI